jgi:single-strand DNA-binding protein
MNVITLIGRAGRDPEVRYNESGTVVAQLTLAVNRRSRDEDPDWFNLKIWGKQAQVAADYVRKGSLIAVSGSHIEDKWTDRKTGEERKKWIVDVRNLELLGKKPDAGDTSSRATSAAAAAGRFDSCRPDEEEVPF